MNEPVLTYTQEAPDKPGTWWWGQKQSNDREIYWQTVDVGEPTTRQRRAHDGLWFSGETFDLPVVAMNEWYWCFIPEPVAPSPESNG